MVIADWEDAVAPADKERARAALAEAVVALPHAQRALLVRINSEGTPWFSTDLQALAQLIAQGVVGAVVPEAERVQTLQAVAHAVGPSVTLVPLVESGGRAGRSRCAGSRAAGGAPGLRSPGLWSSWHDLWRNREELLPVALVFASRSGTGRTH